MSGKKVSFVPGAVVCAGSKSGRTQSFEVEETTKTVCKKHGGGGSSKVTQSRRVEFVDKGNGNKVFKEEVKCKSAVKVDDKVKGRTTESFEVEETRKTVCKKHGGGGSSKVTQSRRGEFVDKGNGNKVFKEEVKWKSAVKLDDKVKGRTTKYEAEIKIKKVTTHNSDNSSKKARAAAAPKPSATSKRIN